MTTSNLRRTSLLAEKSAAEAATYLLDKQRFWGFIRPERWLWVMRSVCYKGWKHPTEQKGSAPPREGRHKAWWVLPTPQGWEGHPWAAPSYTAPSAAFLDWVKPGAVLLLRLPGPPAETDLLQESPSCFAWWVFLLRVSKFLPWPYQGIPKSAWQIPTLALQVIFCLLKCLANKDFSVSHCRLGSVKPTCFMRSWPQQWSQWWEMGRSSLTQRAWVPLGERETSALPMQLDVPSMEMCQCHDTSFTQKPNHSILVTFSHLESV